MSSPMIAVPLRDVPVGLALEWIYDGLMTALQAHTDRITQLEAQVADLSVSVTRLEAAVARLDPNGLSDALEEERAANRALVAAAAAAEATRLELAASEDAEDVVQNADLQAAVDRVNAAQAATDAAADRIDAVSTALEDMVADPEAPGPVVDPTPVPVDPAPVDPAPVDPPVDEPTDPNAPPPGTF